MIEAAHNARMQQAFYRAHLARSEAFVSLLRWLVSCLHVPLRRRALTEPSRCA